MEAFRSRASVRFFLKRSGLEILFLERFLSPLLALRGRRRGLSDREGGEPCADAAQSNNVLARSASRMARLVNVQILRCPNFPSSAQAISKIAEAL
jgi:hypothetical protein